MRTFAAAMGLSAAALITGGCGAGTACPAIAPTPGVVLTVAREYAGVVGTVRLKACQDGRCTEADLELLPGTTAVDQGCEPGSRDGHGVCSATSVPDGTLTGVLMMEVLTASGIELTSTGTDRDGHPLPVRTLAFTPRVDYPFGAECGSFVSAHAVLDAAGLRQQDREAQPGTTLP